LPRLATARIAAVRELATGVWHWQALHPEWEPESAWDHKEVSSYAIDDGERLLLFDPLAVPPEVIDVAAERETAIVLTCPWHRRDAVGLAKGLGAPIYVPPPVPSDSTPVPGEVFRAGDKLPIGVEAFPGREEPNDLVLWVESHRALVAGDTLVDRGRGLEFLPEWAPEGVNPEQILERLQPLRDLPVELVLPTHGPPTDRAALERALDA
jgi:glyoxylase-like metal-dependent hydrolase (beta-lactamase superfamily II)